MADSDRKKLIVILTICIMLISIGLSGCVEEEKRIIEYEYSISVITENGSHGYLYLPFIRTPNYNESIFKEMKSKHPDIINGIVKTDYGILLNISFNSSLELKFNGKLDEYIYLEDEVFDYNRSSGRFIWVYVYTNSSDILNINFIWKMGSSESRDKWNFSGDTTNNGWNGIEGKASHLEE
jgi:hypothetical protein